MASGCHRPPKDDGCSFGRDLGPDAVGDVLMTRNKTLTKRVYVVDAQSSDYAEMEESRIRTGLHVTYFRSGREALRSNPDEAPQMWLVNMELPDMSGCRLHDLLRTRGCRVPIALISDVYREEDERIARIAGASLYLAKPLVSGLVGETCLV